MRSAFLRANETAQEPIEGLQPRTELVELWPSADRPAEHFGQRPISSSLALIIAAQRRVAASRQTLKPALVLETCRYRTGALTRCPRRRGDIADFDHRRTLCLQPGENLSLAGGPSMRGPGCVAGRVGWTPTVGDATLLL